MDDKSQTPENPMPDEARAGSAAPDEVPRDQPPPPEADPEGVAAWERPASSPPPSPPPGAERLTFGPPEGSPPPPAGAGLPYAPAPAPAPPPPPRQRFGWGAFFGGTLLGCGCLSWLIPVLAIGVLASFFGRGETGPKGDSVAVINVTGVITSGEPNGGIFGVTGAEAQRIVEQLKTVRKNGAIKAVVLYINSPGGSAAGSDAVYNEIMKLRGANKPVVAAMGDVAASGGYYIASAADRIFANGATLTGSIGVITELSNVSDPNGWISKSGYDVVTITSGKYKDMGNPFRPMRPEERALLQQMVNDIYGQFLSAVARGRNKPVSEIRPLADGRVFTGRQAKKNGLVDEIGTLQDAIAYAAKTAGMKPDPNVYQMKDNPFQNLMGGAGVMAPTFGPQGPMGLLLLDPRAQALARSLTSRPGTLTPR